MKKKQELGEPKVLLAKSKFKIMKTIKALLGWKQQIIAEQNVIDDRDQIPSAKKSAYIEAIRSGNTAKKRALEIQIRDMKAARAYVIANEINKLKMEYRKNLDIMSSLTASVKDKYWAKKRNEDMEIILRSKNNRMSPKMNIAKVL